MRNHTYRVSCAIAFIVVASILAGCSSSPPTRYYVLNSARDLAGGARSPAGERCLTLGVGPLKMAEYLHQGRIVTRVTPNELRLAPFDQWAEPLEHNISRVLAENLSTLLCTKTVLVFPWSGAIPLDYRVEVEILRLDGRLGEDVALEVQWFVFSGGAPKKLLAGRRSTFSERSEGPGYQTLVSAQSRAVAALSREVAEAIKSLPK
jgi:uncharacterized protein